ncbi:hypothetical protein SAMN05192549_108135 [Duganella sacchari]|uniref:ABC-2 type transport system permease protein n=1 Tax=Duganella sacchari TaxID=551987 RepID=A0A1M7QVY4_9BURK|nr:hypothetical protein [Duganella sacchari]SHN36114.1 hypothetical protein SAMN05192549_108135 [Duganella sacchari]
MYIMKEGRAAYLEFLRNLTPQILMLSLAFFLGRKIDFTKFDWSYATPTFIFYAFMIIAVFAAYANATLFMEKFSPITDMRKVVSRIVKTRKGHLRWKMQLVYFKRRWLVLFEALLMVFAIEFGLAGAFVTAVTSASKMTL